MNTCILYVQVIDYINMYKSEDIFYKSIEMIY